MAPHSTSGSKALSDLEVLDDDHRNILDRAIGNILSTEVAELTYAQILDGLPTERSLWDTFDYVQDHLVKNIGHNEICPGFVEKARNLRTKFELNRLDFALKVT